jgi:hypothetical protein
VSEGLSVLESPVAGFSLSGVFSGVDALSVLDGSDELSGFVEVSVFAASGSDGVSAGDSVSVEDGSAALVVSFASLLKD